jgi:carbamoyl-phosphate synthase large subunit
MMALGIPMPEAGMASNLDEALRVAERIGYPLMVRPSYVLGGRGMEVVYDEEMLQAVRGRGRGRHARTAHPHRQVSGKRHRGRSRRHLRRHRRLVPAVMEHIELAGIHSGDSACVIPPVSIPPAPGDHLRIHPPDRRRAQGGGPDEHPIRHRPDTVYVLEANPRASRTVPLVSKVCNIPMARLATQIMLGKKLSDLDSRRIPHFGVKESVFPFNMFPEVDPRLGPEMRSTGEVLGMADSFGLAFFKAQEAANQQACPWRARSSSPFPRGTGQRSWKWPARFHDLGFKIRATEGTHRFLAEHSIPSERILKLHEGRPNIVDAITNREIHLIINTPSGKKGQYDDSYIRKAAIKYKVPYITTLAAAVAAAKGIAACRQGHGRVKSLQRYHSGWMRTPARGTSGKSCCGPPSAGAFL